MLYQGLGYEGYWLVLYFHDIDGTRQTIKMPAEEAVDLLEELKKEQERLHDIARMNERRRSRKDNVE